MRIHHLIICCVLLLTGGCKTLGNLNSVHRTLDVSQGKGVLIDIKQRAILVSKDANQKNRRLCGTQPGRYVRLCRRVRRENRPP